MWNGTNRQITRKAMAYDLEKIIDSHPDRTSYTPEEVRELIDAYIESSEQQ